MPNIDDLNLDQVVDYDLRLGSNGSELELYYAPGKKKSKTWSKAELGAGVFDEAQIYLARKFFPSDN